MPATAQRCFARPSARDDDCRYRQLQLFKVGRVWSNDMADGGRSAAKGFRYQYMRTLEAMLDAVNDENVEAIYVEGIPAGNENSGAEAVDYELADHAGRTLTAVQVKNRKPGTSIGIAEIFRALAALVQDRDSLKYQLITNALPGIAVAELVATLRETPDMQELRERLDDMLASASAPRARSQLQLLSERHLECLRRVVVTFDIREDVAVHDDLRTRLRYFRNQYRAGLGDAAAGLMCGYMIDQIFSRAADGDRAAFTMADFKVLLLVDGEILTRAVGHRDWGFIIGSIPGHPDIRRKKKAAA